MRAFSQVETAGEANRMSSSKAGSYLFLVFVLVVPAARGQQAARLETVAKDASTNSAVTTKKELPDHPIYQLPALSYKGPLPSHGYYMHGDEIYPRFGFRQVADTNFWALAVALPGAATSFDAMTTFHAISLGNVEGNPLLGPHPTPARVAGIKLGASVLNATSLYVLKREDMRYDYKGWKRDGFPPRWSIMAWVAPALWCALGAHNLTLGRVPPANAATGTAMLAFTHR